MEAGQESCWDRFSAPGGARAPLQPACYNLGMTRTALLLFASNLFMTAAWYGHLKHKSMPLLLTILVSWLIAFPEYCLQVPANRLGHGELSAPQLKILQEAISILVFLGFCALYLKEPVRWNHLAALVLILAGVAVGMARFPGPAAAQAEPGGPPLLGPKTATP